MREIEQPDFGAVESKGVLSKERLHNLEGKLNLGKKYADQINNRDITTGHIIRREVTGPDKLGRVRVAWKI